MLCVLKATKYKQLSDPLALENLPDSRPEDDRQRAHGQCKIYELSANGGGVAVELPSLAQRRRSTGGFPICSVGKMDDATGCAVVACSRLIRKMSDKVIQRAVERPTMASGDLSGGHVVDAEIILSHINSKLAQARWAKANTVLAGLRRLKGLGGLGGAAKGAVKQGARRASVTDVAPHIQGEATSPKPDEGPKIQKGLIDKDCKALCQDFTGAFAFAFVDASRNYVLCARSSDGIAPLFWYWDEKHGLALTSEIEVLPEELLQQRRKKRAFFGEVPPGHYYLGSCDKSPEGLFKCFDAGGDLAVVLDGRITAVDNECQRRLSQLQLEDELEQALEMDADTFNGKNKADSKPASTVASPTGDAGYSALADVPTVTVI
uniref:Glutamine amidotransferase type-2 domain-containing protein n=1 Tax=Pyramimonas obovata TaxID=1411642 RepID=A0A7S0RAD8_9CHLO|mmetsp:Transcript_29352/g.64138  ORF Transcript_29352/g.64138 Transcript_29352/m.64138 type:complete len:377 (+) Transcript_29352:214-1344(+)